MLKKIIVLTVVTISTSCQSVLPGSQQTRSAGELARQYKQSKASMRSNYDGKEITVRGYVINQATMPDTDDYEGLIALEENGGDGASQVLCWFSRKEAPEFSKIKNDRYITVKGIFNGERGMELRFCKLVDVE